MASKKGVGSSKNGRDSESKRLGVKRGDGQYVSASWKQWRHWWRRYIICENRWSCKVRKI